MSDGLGPAYMIKVHGYLRAVQHLSQIVPKRAAATSKTATSCTLTADVSCSIYMTDFSNPRVGKTGIFAYN